MNVGKALSSGLTKLGPQMDSAWEWINPEADEAHRHPLCPASANRRTPNR
jgi:hypothetical protein